RLERLDPLARLVAHDEQRDRGKTEGAQRGGPRREADDQAERVAADQAAGDREPRELGGLDRQVGLREQMLDALPRALAAEAPLGCPVQRAQPLGLPARARSLL